MVSLSPLLKLFGQSPFKPMQEHMRVVLSCAQQVPVLFEAVFAGDAEKTEEARKAIFALENEADDIKNEIRAHLPKSMFLPVDRRDLLEILDLQDSIADTAQDIAGMMVVRDMKPPAALHDPLMTLTRRCVDACDQLGTIMEQMDELVETGFQGPESEKVMYMIDQLNSIETDSDVLAINVMKSLFENESEMDVVTVIMWDRVIHWIGDLANYSERVSNRQRLLIAR